MQGARAKGIWLALGALAFIVPPPSISSVIAVQQQLKTAFSAAANKNDDAAYHAATDAINDPEFPSLDSGTQHAALGLAARTALALSKAHEAHELAVRASQMPQQSVDDWQLRLSAAFRSNDFNDEAICVTTIARQWGRDPSVLSADTVTRAYRDTRAVEYRDAQFAMLSELFDLQWRPARAQDVGYMWRALCLLLLEKNELQRAMQVVTRIDAPNDLIAMRADLRFKSLLKAPYFDSDVHHVARRQLDALRMRVQLNPRSMTAVTQLAFALLTSRYNAEVIELTATVDKRLAGSTAEAPAYDDGSFNYPWILNWKSDALKNLGRFDEAVATLKRAVELPGKDDNVSQPINLAGLLCELDRPDEAALLLPADDKVSSYGKMQIASVRMTVAMEQGKRADMDMALAYMREHRVDSPATLQRALLRAGEFDEAERVLIARLADPNDRSEALVELQSYSPRTVPPREEAWHAQEERLKQQPAVRLAISKIGAIESYSWRYR